MISARHFRKQIDRIIPQPSHGYRLMHYSVLAIGLAAMTATTEPDLRAQGMAWFNPVLWGCLLFFAVELAIKSIRGIGADLARRYWPSWALAIDIAAVVPVPIALAAGVPEETAWLLASLWMFKLAIAFPGLSLLGRIIKVEARSLASVLIIFLLVLMLAGVALYFLEGAAQPAQFGSLPLSLWWAVTTLTTTGYGDAVPQTALGRLIAGIVMICGLGVFGLWTGILATGFAAEHRRREFIRNWDLVTSVPFLRNLDAPAIIELTRMLRRLDVAERAIVVRRGRPGDCMYFIASGEVEVKLEPKRIRLGPGSFFGEIALLEGGPRTATVVATMASTLLVLDVTDFRAFAAHHPTLANDVAREAARRKTVLTESPPADPVSP